MEASMPTTPEKSNNTLIIVLVLAGVAALSILAGYFFKPNQSGDVTSTQQTTQSPALVRQIAKRLAANGIQK
jgi:hypothetical protein